MCVGDWGCRQVLQASGGGYYKLVWGGGSSSTTSEWGGRHCDAKVVQCSAVQCRHWVYSGRGSWQCNTHPQTDSKHSHTHSHTITHTLSQNTHAHTAPHPGPSLPPLCLRTRMHTQPLTLVPPSPLCASGHVPWCLHPPTHTLCVWPRQHYSAERMSLVPAPPHTHPVCVAQAALQC